MPQAGYKSQPLFKMFTMNNLTHFNTKIHTAQYKYAFHKKTEEFVQKTFAQTTVCDGGPQPPLL